MQLETGIALLQWCLGQESGYVAIGAKHSRTREWKESIFSYPDDIEQLKSFISSRSKNSDIYFCPTLLRSPRRLKENVFQSLTLWADLDECNPELLLVKPTIVVQTSPGRYQAFWGLNSPETALDVEEYNRRIAYYHKEDGSDPCWDIVHYLRFPGTKNFKYSDRIEITEVEVIDYDWSRKYNLDDFNAYPEVEGISRVDIPEFVIPEGLTAEDVLNREHMRLNLNPHARELFEEQLIGKGWSEKLWTLELYLLNAGATLEETFAVCKEAGCNKYAREGRPDEHLWKEVCRAKAFLDDQDPTPVTVDSPAQIETEKIYIPKKRLLSGDERSFVSKRKTFIEDYIEWATKATDAPPQYHEAGAFMILSSILSGQVRIPTSSGTLIPNLWFMTLGETTLSRKTTCMMLAVRMLEEVDPEAIMATDGSIEGMMDALSQRAKRSSMFLKDEFSGFLEGMVKKDYQGGIMEHFTQLYDGHNLKRTLRSGPVTIKDPVFLVYGGGIRDRIYQWLTEDYIASGFVPRFVFISPEVDRTKIRPLGPPGVQNIEGRLELIARLQAINDHYAPPIHSEEDDDSVIVFSKTWNVELSTDAWEKYNAYAMQMEQIAIDSDIAALLLPMMDRLSKSGLKAATLIAASQRLGEKITVHKNDIVHAFGYIERWMEYSFDVAANAGKSMEERRLDQIAKFIIDNPGVPRHTLMRRFRLTANTAENTFSTLVQRGVITRQKSQSRAETFSPIKVITPPTKETVTF